MSKFRGQFHLSRMSVPCGKTGYSVDIRIFMNQNRLHHAAVCMKPDSQIRFIKRVAVVVTAFMTDSFIHHDISSFGLLFNGTSLRIFRKKIFNDSIYNLTQSYYS